MQVINIPHFQISVGWRHNWWTSWDWSNHNDDSSN